MSIPECCIDCNDHEVIADPDPHDWFCDDDMSVVCKLKKQKIDKNSRYAADRQPFKTSAVSCRPYNLKKETTPPPKWCPKRK